MFGFFVIFVLVFSYRFINCFHLVHFFQGGLFVCVYFLLYLHFSCLGLFLGFYFLIFRHVRLNRCFCADFFVYICTEL